MKTEMKKIVLIPDRIKESAEIEENIFGKDYKIFFKNAIHKDDISMELWESANAILAWHEINYDKELIDKLKNCSVIVRVGVGFDNIDLKAAKRNNIVICNVPDYGTNDVADHTIALLLTLARGIKAYNEKIINNDTWDWEMIGKLKRLSGMKIGIIGMGRIGNAVAIRAKSLGLKILFYDPYISIGMEKVFGYSRYDNIKDMTRVSDIISFHAPLNNKTENMANDNFFDNMKKDSILLNTARGKIIKMSSLFRAMKKNIVSKAGLDVLEDEPLNNLDPLIRAWRKKEDWIKNRLIITPHSAFYNEESYFEMREKAAIEAKRVLEGNNPLNRII